MGYRCFVKGGVPMITVMGAFLDNIIAFLSSDIGFWLVGAVIFGFLLRLFIQFVNELFR